MKYLGDIPIDPNLLPDVNKENYDTGLYVLTGCNPDRTGICVPWSSQVKNIEPDGETFQTYDECMSMAKNNTCLQTNPYSSELCPNNESCVAAFKQLGWSNDQIVANCCPNSK